MITLKNKTGREMAAIVVPAVISVVAAVAGLAWGAFAYFHAQVKEKLEVEYSFCVADSERRCPTLHNRYFGCNANIQKEIADACHELKLVFFKGIPAGYPPTQKCATEVYTAHCSVSY